MSMFFSNSILSPSYLITGVNKLSNGLALVVGSNLGDNLTLFGALAGLMWIKMLRYNKIKMSYMKFVSYSVKIVPLTILLTCIVLAAEMKFLF